MIAIIIPVLNRPHRVQPLLENIHAVTTVNHQIVFVCTVGDRAELKEVHANGHDPLLVRGGTGEYARKINHGFLHTTQPWVLLAADDLLFQHGWDTQALQHHAGVIGTNDLGNPQVKAGRHSTHPIVQRDYINQHGGTFNDGPGLVYHTGYSHQWCDTELVTAAQARKQWVFVRGSVIEHLHPHWGKADNDDVYRKGMRDYRADQALYTTRLRRFRRNSP
jgi:glycosyltransferase involved in cell wall biosynthesis